MIISKSVEIGNKEITIETGRLARQADGAVTVRCGDTMVLVTAVAAHEGREGIDFFPLSVEYREKTYAAGKIPGGFIKREGRPSDKEVLSARLIDRPIRPLFPDHFKNETQVIAFIISTDSENDADVLAAFGASAALSISDIPFDGPIASVRVVQVDGQFVINPTFSELEKCDLEFVVAGSEDSIVMVEGEANEVEEAVTVAAIKFAHEEIKKLIDIQKQMIAEVNPEKREIEAPQFPEDLSKLVSDFSTDKIKDAIKIREKKERGLALKQIVEDMLESLPEEYMEYEGTVKDMIHDLEKDLTRAMMLKDEIRLDGRKKDQIRDITCELGFLPRAHGSAVFTRGQTQSLGTVTLGTKSDEQIVDGLEKESSKAYMLHYNFPPFCTGEAKPIRGTSRRETGHGNLAERALKPVIPNDTSFPYTIRIVSDILESNGSSSMATVCSGSLAMMDAGVPVKAAVAGIAMGLIKENEKTMILSDILGDEDHLGDMDFKVAGTRKGINAIQMDIKIKGISFEIMAEALERAKTGRLHILDEMQKAIDKPREKLSEYAPKILTIQLPLEKIGMVIGPGGKTIKSITERTDSQIDIEADGTTFISSSILENANKAKDLVLALVKNPEQGQYFKGVVKKIMNFGAFVEIVPGKEGMVHISELDIGHTKNVTDIVKEGDEIDVLIKSVERDGKIALSRKMYLIQNQKKEKENIS